MFCPVLFDHVRRLFRDHNRRRVGVTVNYSGHYGRVDHPQTLDAPHPQPVVNHGVLVVHRTHLARADGVVNGHRVVTGLAFPILVGQKLVTLAPRRGDVVYGGVDLGHGQGLADGVTDFRTLHHRHDVPRIVQVVGHDFRRLVRVRTRDLHVPPAVRPQQQRCYREGVLVQYGLENLLVVLVGDAHVPFVQQTPVVVVPGRRHKQLHVRPLEIVVVPVTGQKYNKN